MHTGSHIKHMLFLHILSTLSDVFLAHQIFSVKSDIWNREIRSTALGCTLKRSAFTEEDGATSQHAASAGEEERVNGFSWTVWLNVKINLGGDSVLTVTLTVLNWASLFFAEVLCSMLRSLQCNARLLSATYCLVAGCRVGEMAGGGESGRDGGGSDMLLHK